mgnify:CR=1 FL=1
MSGMRYLTSYTHFWHPLVTVLRGLINNGRIAARYRQIRHTEGAEEAQHWIRSYADHEQLGFHDLADTEEHDSTLIANINAVVHADDELWILGDVSFRTSMEHTRACLHALHCAHLQMIVGNHDRNFRNTDNDHLYASAFETIDDYDELTMDFLGANRTVALSHFPRRSSIMQHIGTWGGDLRFEPDAPATEGWLLYGHTHQDEPAGTDAKSMNVGLDAWRLKPVSESQVAAWFERSSR